MALQMPSHTKMRTLRRRSMTAIGQAANPMNRNIDPAATSVIWPRSIAAP
jgi:hypothetical protein